MKWYRDDVTIDDYESDYEDEDFSYERREFVGRVANSDVRDKYIHKSVEQFYGNGKKILSAISWIGLMMKVDLRIQL